MSIVSQTEAPNSPLEFNITGNNLTEVVQGTITGIYEEGEGKAKKVKVRGHFGNYDLATANKRFYPKSLWEREITRHQKAMGERQMFGELDHPADGRTMLNRVSHIVTKMWLEDGKVYGEAEILNTDPGRNLQELLKAGCRVGVSSRGYGSTKPNDKGEDVVQDDYKLVTFDFVAEPAAGAFPTVFFEWKGQKLDTKNVTPDILKEAAPELVKAISEAAIASREDELAAKWAEKLSAAEETAKLSLKEELARELLTQVAKAKKELREEVAKELSGDPSIAGAKHALDVVKSAILPFMLSEEQTAHIQKAEEAAAAKIAEIEKTLAETSLKLKGVEDDKVQIENTLKEIGYKLFVEQILDGNAEGRALIGDLKQYATAADIKAKAEAVKAELAKRRADEAAKLAAIVKPAAPTESVDHSADLKKYALALESAERESENMAGKLAKMQKIVEAYEDKLNKTEEALAKSIEGQEELSTQLYAERKLTNNPKAAKLRSVMESSNVRSREQVDSIVESFREPIRDPEDLASVRARVRAQTRGGAGSTALEEETRPTGRTTNGPNGLAAVGISVADFKALSGVGRNK